MNRIDLSGRVALVTGASNGLGLETARRLVACGARLVGWGVSDGAVSALTSEFGDAALCDQVDISDPAQVQRAVDAAVARFGRIDILCNVAGISGPTRALADYPLDDWNRQLAVNLTGVFLVCRAVAPVMVARGYGRIVNVASAAGKDGNPMQSGYVAAKAGVIGLTKSIGKELATSGVVANCIVPTVFETRMSDRTFSLMPPELARALLDKIPMRRKGRREEFAAMAAWLCSEECSFTTGACFDLTGGRSTY